MIPYQQWWRSQQEHHRRWDSLWASRCSPSPSAYPSPARYLHHRSLKIIMIIIVIWIQTTETNGDIKKRSVWCVSYLSYWCLVSPGQRWTGRRWDPPDVWCLFLSCCNSFRLQHVRCALSPPGGRTWNHKHVTSTLMKLTDVMWLILQVTCRPTGTVLCSGVQIRTNPD